MSPPFQVKLPRSGREPDVLFITSPQSEERDRSSRFYEYQDAGVSEYWLIDPDLEQASFYRLDAAGRYQQVAPDDPGSVHSRALPGLRLRVVWLWEDPLPNPIKALLEIDYDTYLQHFQEHVRRAEQQQGDTKSN